MPISQQDLHNALSVDFSAESIEIKDLAGDDDHWQVTITSDKFVGLSRINQHKLVQKSVADYDIHALAIKTKVK